MNAPNLSGLNLVRYGAERDKRILDAIARHKALTTEQIATLYFPFPTGLRKAQARLSSLVGRKKLKAPVRFSIHSTSIYYDGKQPAQLEHLVDVNWHYVWFEKQLTTGQRIYLWERHKDFGILECDALVGIQSKLANEIWWYFIEMERETDHGEFDKIRKYNKLFESQETTLGGHWWWRHVGRFPKVIITCLTENYRQKVLRHIHEENWSNLRFEVKLLSEIIKEAKT